MKALYSTQFIAERIKSKPVTNAVIDSPMKQHRKTLSKKQ